MKTTVNEYDFLEAFRRFGRYDQFGAAALCALFAYLEELEEDTGEEMELDVIALCCDYAVADVATIVQDYNLDVSGLAAADARAAVLGYLSGVAAVIDDDVDGQILYYSAF